MRHRLPNDNIQSVSLKLLASLIKRATISPKRGNGKIECACNSSKRHGENPFIDKSVSERASEENRSSFMRDNYSRARKRERERRSSRGHMTARGGK